MNRPSVHYLGNQSSVKYATPNSKKQSRKKKRKKSQLAGMDIICPHLLLQTGKLIMLNSQVYRQEMKYSLSQITIDVTSVLHTLTKSEYIGHCRLTILKYANGCFNSNPV
uniref:Uncharacterized protein n=2 Tax=Arion vulgaris TaxID=1028688 RepID=A0A0B6ZD13_9EUPU